MFGAGYEWPDDGRPPLAEDADTFLQHYRTDPMSKPLLRSLCLLAAIATTTAQAAEPAPASSAPTAAAKPAPADAALATQLGADHRGMRKYVLVILRSGPNRMPDGEARKAMFQGHFDNIRRLAGEGKLAVAGPFSPDKGSDWRGLFVLAVETIEAAKALVDTDPVIGNGEMVAEYHPWYATAALMAVPDLHKKIEPK